MKVIGLNLQEVERIVRLVSSDLFNDNLRVLTGRDRSKGKVPRCTFTLGVWNSGRGELGTRCLNMLATGSGPHGKARTFTACWHAHFYVIEGMVNCRPPGVVTVQTSKATYDRDNYLDVGYASAFMSTGTGDAIAYQLCECDDNMWPFEDDLPSESLVGDYRG